MIRIRFKFIIAFITTISVVLVTSSEESELEPPETRRLKGDKNKGAPTGQTAPAPVPIPVPVAPAPTAPTSKPALALVAVNYQPTSAFPLKKCQGQCYGDGNCQSGLTCYKLFQRDPEVPGCSGTPEPGRGYCFNLTDYPKDNGGGTTKRGDRLKLWWQKGYYWQGETFDRRWCMYCSEYCAVFSCNMAVSHFKLIPAPFGMQISLAGTNKCLQRVQNIGIVVLTCDASKTAQWFTGSFNSYRFEIHPYGVPKGCLTQTHYAKGGDPVYVVDCATARNDTGSYWQLY